MVNDPLSLPLTKPISVWNKPLKADFRALFKALSKTATSAATGRWADAAVDTSEAAAAIGLETSPEEIAWRLVRRAFVRAVAQLADEYGTEARDKAPTDLDALTDQLDLSVEFEDFTLERGLFERPASIPLLQALKKPVAQWLHGHGLEVQSAAAVANRLPAYFVYALNEEWRRRPSDYVRLATALDTPFTRAGERERAWFHYAAHLQRQVRERMFDEPFCLADVYVPLRASYSEQTAAGNSERRGVGPDVGRMQRVIVDLGAALHEWRERADPRDAVRVLSGGPGSGKSSFVHIFAAECSARGQRVLLVPLYLFDASADLERGVGDFVRSTRVLTANPLDTEDGAERLLLVFDGLDELAMQGRAATEAAQAFVDEILRFCEKRNYDKARVQVLVSGRELVVQASSSLLRRRHQVLHLLPYWEAATAQRRSRERRSDLDPDELLRKDQRHEWWQRYGAITGRNYDALPKPLQRNDLREITAHPLLNYLLALSFTRGQLDFSQDVNLNEIYDDLLTAVHERAYAGRPHLGIMGLEREQFVRVLEEIGLAAWQGDGRTTTVKEIEAHCRNAGLVPIFERFQEGVAKSDLRGGVTRLLTAFYFRQHGQLDSGERTFEFTHQSFGEYLTALRLVRAISKMHTELERRRNTVDEGWDERDALKHWTELTGPTGMDTYLHDFVGAEMRRRAKQAVAWQKTLARLFEFMLGHGMPMERLLPRPDYAIEARHARNAEESLLVCLYACALTTGERSDIEWPEPTSLGAWLGRVLGQRTSLDVTLALRYLGYLDCRGAVLELRDLYQVNLRHAELSDARLRSAILCGADLTAAKLNSANLSGADLSDANLSSADLSNAALSNADLSNANMSGTDLSSADLSGAKLDGANLSGANLTEANLSGVVLSDTNMSEANLSGANLRSARLNGANLSSANLSGARLEGASLSGAQLNNANLDQALGIGNIEQRIAAAAVPRTQTTRADGPTGWTQPTPPTFFLAHASADEDRARDLYCLLNPDVATFLDVVDVAAGDEWPRVVREAQRAARATIVLVSGQSDAAYYLSEEIAAAIAYQRAEPERHRLIPVYLDGRPIDPASIPYGLRVRHSLDLAALGIDGVVAELRRVAAALAPPRAPLLATTPGPRAGSRLRLCRALCGLSAEVFDAVVARLGALSLTSAEADQPRDEQARDLVQWAEERGESVYNDLTQAVHACVASFAWLDARRREFGLVNVPGPDYEIPFDASDLVVALQLQLHPLERATRAAGEPVVEGHQIVTVDFRKALHIVTRRPLCLGLAVVGDPGSGKTTLLQQIYCEVYDQGSETVGLPPGLTPVLVRCKAFERIDGPKTWTFRKLVEAQAEADGWAGAAAELWSGDYPVLLLLDGLDEVRDEELRAAICDWLSREAAKLHGSWYFVVTSRVATWQRAARLREELFLTADALALDEPSIRGYVERWFRAVTLREQMHEDRSRLEQRAATQSKALLDEIYSEDRRRQRTLHELMGNPLSLALLCQVHTRHAAIPQRLGDLYAACLQILLERRPREEERPFLPVNAARAVLQPLAWHMQNEAAEELPRLRLEAEVARTMHRLQLRDLKWLDAQEFLRRAWEDCGVLRSRDYETLGFFAAALREYLAASHAVEERQFGALADHAGEPRWRNVLLLAMSLKGGFSGLAHELMRTRQLAAHEELLREGLHAAVSVEPRPFLAALEAAARRGGWRAALRRWIPSEQVQAPTLNDLLALLRLLELRDIPAIRESVRALADDSRSQVRAAARRFLAPGGAAPFETMAGQLWREPVTGITFVWIPSGEFRMGAAPGLAVQLTQGFWIAQHPVTNEVYGRFVAATPSHREPAYWRNARFNKPELPVVGVDDRDALAFCEWATSAAGLENDQVIDLPTEAEWEYTARAAGDEAARLRTYPWGNSEPTPERAVFRPSDGTASVGGRPAGATSLGVHDMAGNVAEWCLDAWVESDKATGGIDPVVLSPESPVERVVRGGSWNDFSEHLHSAYRVAGRPFHRSRYVGFRVVCRRSRHRDS